MNEAEKSVLIRNKEVNWAPADAILIAALLFPDEIILEEKYYHCAEVELKGDRTRGQLVLRRIPDCKEQEIVRIIKLVNRDYFKTVILAAAKNTHL